MNYKLKFSENGRWPRGTSYCSSRASGRMGMGEKESLLERAAVEAMSLGESQVPVKATK